MSEGRSKGARIPHPEGWGRWGRSHRSARGRCPAPRKGRGGGGGREADLKEEVGEGGLAVAPPTALIDEGAFDAGG